MAFMHYADKCRKQLNNVRTTTVGSKKLFKLKSWSRLFMEFYRKICDSLEQGKEHFGSNTFWKVTITSVAKNLRSDKYQKQHISEVASIIRYDIHIKSNFDSRKICLKTLSKIEKNANWPNRYSSKWINNAPNRNFVWKKSITKNYLNLS